MLRKAFFFFLGLPLALILCGCQRGPVAPELRNSPVYNNSREGFRFLVPEGWTISASANIPSGDLETDLFLVQYNVRTLGSDGQVHVICFQDKQKDIDLAQYHTKPAFGIQKWSLKEGPTKETIHGKEGTWLYYTGRNKGPKMGQDVLAFRKGDRVYSFVGLCEASDNVARQSIHRAFASVIWK